MSLLNYEDTELKLTIGDIVQTFTEADLQESMPVYMEDISASTKDKVAVYQKLIEDGDYAGAADYKKANTELDTLILDSKKINSLWAYLAFTYLYAKNKRQQISVSKEQPTDQETGDFWLKYDPDSTNENLPLYMNIGNNTYKQIWIQPNIDYATSKDIAKLNTGSVNGNKIVNLSALDAYAKTVDQKLTDFFQSGNDFKKCVSDEIIANGLSETQTMNKAGMYNCLCAGNIRFDSFEKAFDITSIDDYLNDSGDFHLELEIPHNYKDLVYSGVTITITENIAKYEVVRDTVEVDQFREFVFSFNHIDTILAERSYTFDLVGLYNNHGSSVGKYNIGYINFSLREKPEVYSEEYGDEYFDQDIYYTLSKSFEDDENFKLVIESSDEWWKYVKSADEKSVISRPVKIVCTVNNIFYKK